VSEKKNIDHESHNDHKKPEEENHRRKCRKDPSAKINEL
jgi:hypothetical protein